MATVKVQKIKSTGYEISFGHHALAELSEMLSTEEYSAVKLFILVDENTLENCLSKLIEKVPVLAGKEVIQVESGEGSKSVEISVQIWSALSEMEADRKAVLLNLGGGVVTDLGGFLAGTFKRGIRFINIPTSLLAQVDASVGSKVGINLNNLKNQIGLFCNPEKVFIDPEFLRTLPRNHLLSGFAEMIKHALIFDKDYWKQLKDVSFYEMETLDEAIPRSIEIKNEIVISDPFEAGRRKILNFGHTVGHAIESYSFESDGRTILHGEAIAAGMVCEAFISEKIQKLTKDKLEEITRFVFSLFPRIQIQEIAYHRLVELMKHDKKNEFSEIRMSLLNDLGDCNYDIPVKAELIIESLNYYRRWVN